MKSVHLKKRSLNAEGYHVMWSTTGRDWSEAYFGTKEDCLVLFEAFMKIGFIGFQYLE